MAIIIQGLGPGSTLRDSNTNLSNGSCSTVAGGQSNTALLTETIVGGGCRNTAGPVWSTIGGGSCNRIAATKGSGSAPCSTIVGGWRNAINVNSERSTIGGGACNNISGIEGFIGGGICNNIITGVDNTIAGGSSNSIRESNVTIGGGQLNRAFAINSVILGGNSNLTQSISSVIGGGDNNTILPSVDGKGNINVIGGGARNTIDPFGIFSYSTILGGQCNFTSGANTVIGGGTNNTALQINSIIGGGSFNLANAASPAIGGGVRNTTLGQISSIGGGSGNTITTTACSSTIGGGFGNTITGQRSAILGSSSNKITGNDSFIIATSSSVSANRSVALGGSNVNVTVDDSVYVPKLNIRSFPNTSPIYGLAVDANGFVVPSTNPGVNFVVDAFLSEGSPDPVNSVSSGLGNDLSNSLVAVTQTPTLQYNDYIGSYNNVTGIWTCPQSGRWNMSFYVHLTGPDAVNGWYSLAEGMIYAGIVDVVTGEVYASSTFYTSNIQKYADINGGQWGVLLNAGDQLCVRVLNTTGLNYTTVAPDDYVRFSTQRVG